VLVVDNNSQDDTAAVIAAYAKQWSSDSRLRYVFEPRQGMAYARECAIWNSTSDLIGFLDDDNLPNDDWVAQAYYFGKAHPKVGAYGSNVHPKLDEVPPADFDQVKIYLAITDRGPVPYCYKRTYPRLVPIGAGCVIRKQAWMECVPEKRRLWGRSDHKRKVSPGASEDMEVMFNIQNGWEVWHNGNMVIWHHLPAKRLETDYLLRIARSGGLAAHACRIAQLQPWQRRFMPILSPVLMCLDAARVAVCYLKDHRHFSHDRGKACHFQFRLGRLLSQFVTPPPTAYRDCIIVPKSETRLSACSPSTIKV
jgi:glycosyltransferase involved in cell wall biosynthesis